jgi:hypothetical protein
LFLGGTGEKSDFLAIQKPRGQFAVPESGPRIEIKGIFSLDEADGGRVSSGLHALKNRQAVKGFEKQTVFLVKFIKTNEITSKRDCPFTFRGGIEWPRKNYLKTGCRGTTLTHW